MTSAETNKGRERAAWLKLIESTTIRKQQAAFACTTGLTLTLVPTTTGVRGSEAARVRGLFCVDGCMGEHSGDLCQRTLTGAKRRAAQKSEPRQFRCPTGLLKIIVPVFVGGQHVGNLLAGPFSQQRLDKETLSRLARRLRRWGLEKQVAALRASWRYSPLLTDERGQSVTTLLELFAQYLSERGNQVLTHEPKQSSRLLLNPFRRVSEVAFEAGFESIPYFNRVFRRSLGCSPSEYRAAVARTTEDKRLTI